MKEERNFPSQDECYFIGHIDYRDALRKKSPLNAIRVAWRSIYSIEARKKIGWLLDDVRSDVASPMASFVPKIEA
jgi:hypothetical protein